jgi:thioredoxin
MSGVIRADDASFEREVLQQKGTVVVDFGAEWCPPCRVLERVLEALARERAGAIKVVQVDTDASPESARRFGIRATPTLVVFRDGQRVATHVGAAPRERIEALLRP